MPTLTLLTIDEVAETLRVSKATVYRLVRTGELPASRVGPSIRVSEADLIDFLHKNMVEGPIACRDPRRGKKTRPEAAARGAKR